ncbi:MAG: ribosomal-processing cysteine protease Prp, partial [Bacilli bacterium]|nr:ribosomal-processing cysteine protease Prp [Bacilli bacterium]
TKVIITKEDGYISNVIIKDHSNYDEYGQDIVCAGISSIVIGGLNALERKGLNKDYILVDEKDNCIIINLINDEVIQTVIDTIIIQLITIEDEYGDYLKITFK